AIHVRDVRGRQGERRLGETVEVAWHKAVAGEGDHPVARQVERLHGPFIGARAEKDVAHRVRTHRSGETTDLLGRVGQPREFGELARVEGLGRGTESYGRWPSGQGNGFALPAFHDG